MSDSGGGRDPKQIYPSAERNKEPIKMTIGEYLDKDITDAYFLEISSGSGQHIAHLAEHYPWITYQPTEFNTSLFDSINAYTANLPNVKPVMFLDSRQPSEEWLNGALAENSVHYILNVNMMHIADKNCFLGLFSGCGRILKPGQYLFTYGPYAFDGTISPLSNVNFNEYLRYQNPEWSLRDVKLELEPVASKHGLRLASIHPLPMNNHMLVWQKKKSIL